MDEWRRSGQIPAFGNWEHANELPITQYFESARQAGLIRYSNSSGECGQYMPGDLYAAPDLTIPSRNLAPSRKTRMREKRGPHVNGKEQRKQGKVCDVTEPPRKQPPPYSHHVKKDASVPASRPALPVRAPKPVDEDLYKIPSDLLRSSKRKKRPGFFSCLVPDCAS